MTLVPSQESKLVIVIAPSVGIEEKMRTRRHFLRREWEKSLSHLSEEARDGIVLKFIVGSRWARGNNFYWESEPGSSLKKEVPLSPMSFLAGSATDAAALATDVMQFSTFPDGGS